MARVLIIDDNTTVRRVISYTLGKIGHVVLAAADAYEGQSILNSPPGIELVILDVSMPKMDGLTLLKKLRSESRFQALPVIMLTASCDDHDHVTALAEGADAFLTKPASSQELVETVNRLITLRGVRVC